MGNVFDGDTESFLLYVCIPGLAPGLVVAFFLFQRALARRVATFSTSWPSEPAAHPPQTVRYRTPAAVTAFRIPTRIRVVATSTFLWGTGIAAFWALSSVGLAALVGLSPYLVFPLAAACFGGLTCAHLARTSLSLMHRDPVAVPRIERARTWIAVHHGTVLVLGTGLLFLLALSNQFFWNGMSDHRAAQLLNFLVLYGLFVLAPSVVGLVLSSQLGRITALYRAAA